MLVSHVKKHILQCKQWRVISPQGINTPSVQTINTFHEQEVLFWVTLHKIHLGLLVETLLLNLMAFVGLLGAVLSIHVQSCNSLGSGHNIGT